MRCFEVDSPGKAAAASWEAVYHSSATDGSLARVLHLAQQAGLFLPDELGLPVELAQPGVARRLADEHQRADKRS